MNIKEGFNKIEMKTWFFISGFAIIWLFSYLKFNPNELVKILAPVLLASSFVLLGVFAIDNIRKSVLEHYKSKRENILREIRRLRKQEETEDLTTQITMDQNILSLRESLKGFQNNRFERCLIYVTIWFILTLISAYIDIGNFIETPNMIVQVVLFLFGFYYFCQMLVIIFASFHKI